jgi:L-alanine-DL-glutamate epimerase-like enolase superfamily enzyme
VYDGRQLSLTELDRSETFCRLLREAVGTQADLLFGTHGQMTAAGAIRLARRLEKYDPMWFEEPVTADDKRGMAEVRASTAIPIAAGESEFNRFDFRDLAELRAADVFQPDLAICGGVSEAMRIGAIATAWNLKLAPHLWTGALAFAAGMHVAAASPAGWLLEYSVGANPLLQELAVEQFTVKDGKVAIPDRPGLGVTVRQEFVDRYAVT